MASWVWWWRGWRGNPLRDPPLLLAVTSASCKYPAFDIKLCLLIILCFYTELWERRPRPTGKCAHWPVFSVLPGDGRGNSNCWESPVSKYVEEPSTVPGSWQLLMVVMSSFTGWAGCHLLQKVFPYFPRVSLLPESPVHSQSFWTVL